MGRQDAKSAKKYTEQEVNPRPKPMCKSIYRSATYLHGDPRIGSSFLFSDFLGALGVLAASPVLK